MFKWSDAKAYPVEAPEIEPIGRQLIQANWVLGAVNCIVVGQAAKDRAQVQFSWDFAQGFQILGPEINCLGELKLGIFPTKNPLWRIENSPIIAQWAENEDVFEMWKDDTSHWALFTEDASVHIIAVEGPRIMEQH